MPIVAELSRRAIQQLEAFGGTDPESASLILKQCTNVVAGERGRLMRLVPESLYHPPFAIEPVETAIERRDPIRTAAIFDDARNLVAGECPGIAILVFEMFERMLLGEPAIEADVSSDPHGPGTVHRESQDVIARQRIHRCRIVTQMLDRTGGRIQHIDSRVRGADPDLAARIQGEGPDSIAGQRPRPGGVVAEGRESVGVPVPAGDACILECDPQIPVSVFDDLEDEVAWQTLTLRRRIGIAL